MQPQRPSDRSLGYNDLCRNPEWPTLAEFIYTSTPSSYRDLRDIVVREVLYASRHDRARFTMQTLKEAVKMTPELAIDLATIILTNQTFRCDKCDHEQYLLVLPCSHKESHETDDDECYRLGLSVQECSDCHSYGVFKGLADHDGKRSYL